MHVFVISCTHKRENIKSFKKKKKTSFKNVFKWHIYVFRTIKSNHRLK